MSVLARQMLFVLVGVVVPFFALEWFVEERLFEEVSYSNSLNLDHQLASLDRTSDWDVVFVGSSEVRWGISPDDFDDGFRQASGIDVSSFNFGIDGFSPGLIYRVLQDVSFRDLFPEAEILFVGVNLAESNYLANEGYQPGACGALQAPVLTSAFGRDHGLDAYCIDKAPVAELVNPVLDLSGTIRHRRSLREYVLSRQDSDFIPRQSNALEYEDNGFQPHKSIEESRRNFQSSWDRRLEEKSRHPDRFEPLPPDMWPGIIGSHGFFRRWQELGEDLEVEIVFFALPTSPMFYQLYDRRDDYERNSRLIAEWAEENGALFIDLGIPDDLELEHHYSDFRHLSRYGAPVFSERLGLAAGSIPEIEAALADGR